MKLLRYGELGFEKPGILDSEGQIRDLSSLIQDINPSTINMTSATTPPNPRQTGMTRFRGPPRFCESFPFFIVKPDSFMDRTPHFPPSKQPTH